MILYVPVDIWPLEVLNCLSSDTNPYVCSAGYFFGHFFFEMWVAWQTFLWRGTLTFRLSRHSIYESKHCWLLRGPNYLVTTKSLFSSCPRMGSKNPKICPRVYGWPLTGIWTLPLLSKKNKFSLFEPLALVPLHGNIWWQMSFKGLLWFFFLFTYACI